MMKKNNQSQKLILGRAGELTTTANTLTFSILEGIFGFKGPYRNTLEKFGVPVNVTHKSFIKNIEEKVYSDIDMENHVLWENLPFKLVLENNTVKTSYDWSGNFIKKFVNFCKKTILETLIIISIEKYTDEVRKKYQQFSSSVDRVLANRSLTFTEFLKLYETVVYITYLYELIAAYNENYIKDLSKGSLDKIKTYVLTNDYLINGNNSYLEYILKFENGFYFTDFENLRNKLDFKISEVKLIPNHIPQLILGTSSKLKLIAAEKTLQCTKNNIRLKTNILIFFLNKTLAESAKSKKIQNYLNVSALEIEHDKKNK